MGTILDPDKAWQEDGTAMWWFLLRKAPNILYELAVGLRVVSVQQNC